MAQNGNEIRLYLVDSNTNTYVVGQTSANYNLNDDLIEVTDKLTQWKEYISGGKSWSASLSLNLDNSATAQQIEFVKSLKKGQKLTVFIGVLKDNQQSDGIAGEVWVASVDNTADNNAIASRSVNLTGNGEPTIIEPAA